ncbi:hypothetical protein [Aurantibacillus circumpalustris]|uniref:hypothetical protein n=1 Tax=Aurantibacillus circumpalustris TaxID=3036359 RepID=UPI00295AD5A0|nr:hypothetical protein [Aurantibacillus circumpalustris]
MYRFIFIALFFASFASAQTKKPVTKSGVTKTNAVAAKDTLAVDTAAIRIAEAEAIPKEFAVYTKKPKKATDRMKLCVNLVSPENTFNYCHTDSICRDPEKFKLLFQKKNADTTFALVYVQAFSKPADRPSCDAGKEVKLFFMRWNTTTNKALVKIRTVESCMKNIVNMTKESIDAWDQTSPLVFKYYRGTDKFLELTFDPNNYLLGLQTANDLNSD